MPQEWIEDRRRDGRLIEPNTLSVARAIVDDAPARNPPTLDLARSWHRHVYAGVQVPVPYYVGEFRDSDANFPELMQYEVRVGTAQGVPCAEVPDHLTRFGEQMRAAAELLDPQVRHQYPPALSGVLLGSILVFCANAHGEWIRIHPFANGNGRTARLWVLWVSSRYALPPFIRIKPRPHGHLYASAASASMRGDHRPMVRVFSDMLADRVRRGPGGS